MKVAVFCEARADFELATALLDRIAREEGPAWARDLFPDYASSVREWLPDDAGNPFFDVHHLKEYARHYRVRRPQGHFAGTPGEAGALMARTAFAISRVLDRASALSAVLFIWDMDDQGQQRRTGLSQARTEANHWATFRIVLGCPDPMREAWVLAGFEPMDEAETRQLEALGSELGYDPTREGHRLGAKREQGKHSAKRVLGLLTSGEYEREARCWQLTPLDSLETRSGESGLREYLQELRDNILPLLDTPRSDSG